VFHSSRNIDEALLNREIPFMTHNTQFKFVQNFIPTVEMLLEKSEAEAYLVIPNQLLQMKLLIDHILV